MSFAVQATFGDRLQHVLQIDQIDISASVASVNEHLDMLRPAIKVRPADCACTVHRHGRGHLGAEVVPPPRMPWAGGWGLDAQLAHVEASNDELIG